MSAYHRPGITPRFAAPLGHGRAESGPRCARNWSAWASRLRARYAAARRHVARSLRYLRRPTRATMPSNTTINHFSWGTWSNAQAYVAIQPTLRLDRYSTHISPRIVERSVHVHFGDRLQRMPLPPVHTRTTNFARERFLDRPDRSQLHVRQSRTSTADVPPLTGFRTTKATAILRKVIRYESVARLKHSRHVVVQRFRRLEQSPRERLLQRLFAPTSVEERSRPAANPGPMPALPPCPAPQAFVAQPQSPLSVDALADRVMDKINRRMTVWRERTGRA